MGVARVSRRADHHHAAIQVLAKGLLARLGFEPPEGREEQTFAEVRRLFQVCVGRNIDWMPEPACAGRALHRPGRMRGRGRTSETADAAETDVIELID